MAKLSWRPFEEAKEFVRGLELGNQNDWRKYAQNEDRIRGIKPSDIPSNPDKTYINSGWLGYSDWLGVNNRSSNLVPWRPFEEALEFARSLKLKKGSDWRSYCQGGYTHIPKRPLDIPANPMIYYKDSGWKMVDGWAR